MAGHRNPGFALQTRSKPFVFGLIAEPGSGYNGACREGWEDVMVATLSTCRHPGRARASVRVTEPC